MTTKCGLVALFGPPNVGKSTLLNALLGQKIAPMTHKPGTTRRSIRGILTKDDCQMVFVDTPGIFAEADSMLSFMRREAMAVLGEVDVIAFVMDVAGKGAQRKYQDFALKLCLEAAKDRQIPVLLVLNKIDRLPEKPQVLPLMKEWIEKGLFTSVIPISATRNEGIESLVKELKNHLPQAEFLFDPEMVTDSSEREIVAELIREQAMLELGQELPYQVGVIVEEFDESRREDKKKQIVEIGAVIFVERESQKAIVVGQKGQKIKAIGTRARGELETLLGCQVMLRLVVRVEPGWSGSPKGLKKMGYS